MRWLPILALLTTLAIAQPGAAATLTCTSPDDAAAAPALPFVANSLRSGETLNVLAIGSANLFRPEAGTLITQSVQGARTTSMPPAQVMSDAPSGTAFPQLMANTLEKLVPGAKVKVTVRGGRGLSATDQLQILSDIVEPGKFQLVVWQTGTVEAVRNLPPSEFAQTLADGIEKSVQSGADIVLVDPQYSRFLQTNSNIEPYEQAFQMVGSMPHVALFHRFELMRNWVNDGQIDLERTPKANRVKAVEQLHECLGTELARLVLGGARS